jgi:hypothetical protein
MKPINIQILEQGGPKLNGGYIIAETDNFVAFEIDMDSKHCGISGYSGSTVYIGYSGSTVYIEGTEYSSKLIKGLEDKQTHISFPDYAGWYFWVAEIARYTFRGTLIKEE